MQTLCGIIMFTLRSIEQTTVLYLYSLYKCADVYKIQGDFICVYPSNMNWKNDSTFDYYKVKIFSKTRPKSLSRQ